jgi:hypothetical protein
VQVRHLASEAIHDGQRAYAQTVQVGKVGTASCIGMRR